MIAAIVGHSNPSMTAAAENNSMRFNPFSKVSNSAQSVPAQNTSRPLPVMTTTRTVLSRRMSRRRLLSSATTRVVMQLPAFGRLKVMVATASFFEQITIALNE
jgi:hypothetical protein